VSVVDAHAGAVRRYITGETDYTREDPTEYRYTPEMPVDVILASASIPVLLPAVPLTWEKKTSLYWDGGLLVNTPLRPVVDLEAERVVTVLCTIGGRDAQPSFDNLNHALERLADTFFENTYNVDCKLLLKRNELSVQESALESANARPKNLRVLLYKAVRPRFGEVKSYIDFTPASAELMFKSGRDAAIEWIAQGPAYEGELEHKPLHPYGD
jgi:predicted acylesterase/phospholipase RssA